jgi:hypothetical protein
MGLHRDRSDLSDGAITQISYEEGLYSRMKFLPTAHFYSLAALGPSRLVITKFLCGSNCGFKIVDVSP